MSWGDETKAAILYLGAVTHGGGAGVLPSATPGWNSRISSKLLRSAPGAAARSGVGVFMEPLGTGGKCQERPDTDLEAARDDGWHVKRAYYGLHCLT